jgi:hypothetical protein
MKIKIYKEFTVEKDKTLKFLGIDIFIIPVIKFYYTFTKVEEGELKFQIYLAFLFWTISINFIK